MKILIVEDEEVLAKVLQDKFKKSGNQTQIVGDGKLVLPAVKEFKPDIILLDLILPGKNGLDILEDLKADADLKIIPVIVLSNLDGDEEIKKALKLGAADYFVKSQHALNEVVEKVNEVMK